MAAVASPYGLRAVESTNGRYVGKRRGIPVTTNNSAAMFFGDPVSMTSGVLASSVATPTTTRSASTPVGVFVGCEYTDPIFGRVFKPYLPANSVTAGYTSIIAYIEDDPGAEFMIQADGAVTALKIGLNGQLSFSTAGSTTTGQSGVALIQSTLALTATFAVRIVDLVNLTDATLSPHPNDAYTDCIVRWNAGVHAYANSTGA